MYESDNDIIREKENCHSLFEGFQLCNLQNEIENFQFYTKEDLIKYFLKLLKIQIENWKNVGSNPKHIKFFVFVQCSMMFFFCS